MRAKVAARYALFLVLLVLGQEFSIARYSGAPIGDEPFRGQQWSFGPEQDYETKREEPIYSAEYNLKPLPGDLDSDYRDLTEEDFKIFDDVPTDYKVKEEETKKEEADKDDEGEDDPQIDKRSWFAIAVLGVSLGFTLAEVGAELYYTLAGCCHSLPKACYYKDKFKAAQDLMKVLNTRVDDKTLLATNLLTDIKLTNGEITTLMNKVMKIMELEEAFLTALRTPIIKEFETKWSAIAAQLKDKNRTVEAWSAHEVSVQFDSSFSTVKGALMTMGNVFFGILEVAGYFGYKHWKNKNLAKKFKAGSKVNSPSEVQMNRWRSQSSGRSSSSSIVDFEYKVRRASDVKGNLKKSGSGGKWSKGLKTTGKVLTVLVVAGQGVLTVLSIMAKKKNCEDKLANAKKNYEDLSKFNAKLTGLDTNITDYVEYINREGADYLLSQLRSQKLLGFLGDIKALLDNAGKLSLNNRIAAAAVEKYITDIVSAPFNSSYDMMTSLINGLARVEFLYRCYTSKVQLSDYIVQHCIDGNYDLKTLWLKGSTTWNTTEKACIDKSGIPYYTYDDAVIKINNTFQNTNYTIDCIINKAKTREQACRYVNVDGYTTLEAAGLMKLKESQVIVMLKNCPPLELNDAEKTQICKFRGKGWSDDKIHTSLLNYIEKAKIVAYVCPTTAAP